MAACHRPDFAGFRKTQMRAPRSRTCPSAVYLWPYVNIEDLQQNNPLLLFINSRGRTLPDRFISADIEAAHLRRGWNFCPNAKSDSMDFYDRRSPLTYGRVIRVLEDMPRGGSAPVKSVIRYHPSLGLVGLEIQAAITVFPCTASTHAASTLDKMAWNAKKGVSVMKIVAGFGLDVRKLQRTPLWKEPLMLPAPIKTQPSAILSELPASTPAARRLSQHLMTAKKVKVKTRGTPTSMPTPTIAVDEDPVVDPTLDEAQTPLVTVKVPRRTYRVLSALIPPSGAENHHRPEVAWDELLHAMLTIGLQPEKLYGSVWIFAPMPKEACKVELDLKRSIQFHEPKEVRRGNKISPHMVRTLGRRLTHAFGWEAGMFECE
ncbi:hypothetical protein LTR08_002067 [Meristemomyces frigidus]|nr:hypothetical protein LTR08_002067 [Meristemomyces frigidus]